MQVGKTAEMYPELNYFSLQFLTSPFFKKRFYLFTFERGREGEREGEKYPCGVASRMAPTGDLAQNPDMCPRSGIKPATL